MFSPSFIRFFKVVLATSLVAAAEAPVNKNKGLETAARSAGLL